jgi:hypothetical protein
MIQFNLKTKKDTNQRSPITYIDLIQSKVIGDQGFDLVFAKPNSSFSDDVSGVKP